MEAVVFDVVFEGFAFADASGVDRGEGSFADLKLDIDAVACCAGQFRDDDAFGAGECVSECAFTGVAFSDDGEFHADVFDFMLFGTDVLGDGVDEVELATLGGGGDGDGFAETELGGFECVCFVIGMVDLVGDEDDGGFVSDAFA